MIISILVLTVILSAVTLFLINKLPKIKTILQILYAVFIVALGVLLILSIMKPINFDQKRDKREKAAIERMKLIRTIQAAYKSQKGEYANNFNKLIKFVKKDTFQMATLVKMQEWNQDSISEKDALKMGIIKKTIVKKSVYDSLCGRKYNINNIRYIPYTDSVEFSLDAGEVLTASNVKVKVYQLYAPYKVLFDGLDKQLVINYIDERKKITDSEGLQVGSMDMATNNEGNWE